MRAVRLSAAVLTALAVATALPAQDAPKPGVEIRPIASARFTTRYLQIGRDAEGLLYEPTGQGANVRIALMSSHPNANTFGEPLGREMAARGYRVLMVNYRGDPGVPEAALPALSRGIAWLRMLPNVERVVLVGHSGGGHLAALYQNVAENGPGACSDAAKLYPCRTAGLANLVKADGIILLDPAAGAFHPMSATDPAIGQRRIAALDMFAPANGYDPATGQAHYTAAFAARFQAAQAARNRRLVETALTRLREIERGAGRFVDDEPLVIPGAATAAIGARLYQPDTAFLAHTRRPHTLLRPDGSTVEVTIPSVRPPSGQQATGLLRTLDGFTQNTTVRRFLAGSAIRTTTGYAITADDIRGVDWHSAITATPGNAEGITVPALVLVMSCHYFVVPGEIVFDHLASRDKSYAAVEGATHLFQPCTPRYGDTMRRTFDHLSDWLHKEGRFG